MTELDALDERIARIARLTRGLALCCRCHIFSTGMYLNGEPVCSACWPHDPTEDNQEAA